MSEKTVQKRRIRTDQQNRDYKCPCGKSYLSYPALYTHLKQKHSEDMQDYLSRIEKPATTTLERGRPKAADKVRATTSQQMTQEYSLLTIMEILTIQLVDLLKENEELHNHPLILVGNANLSLEEVRALLPAASKEVQQLLEDPLPQQRLNFLNLCCHFCRTLSKHFSPLIVAHFVVFFAKVIQYYAERHQGDSTTEAQIDTHFFNEFIVQMERAEPQEYTWSDSRAYKKILQAFGNWMYTQGYTRTRVQINQEEKSDRS